MVAVTSFRTDHLTVTRIKLATLTQREAMGLVWTQELVIASLHQGDECLDLSVHQLAVNTLNVHNMRIVLQLLSLIDRFEPLHVAVASNGVSAQVECWLRQAGCRQTNGVLRKTGDLID